MGTAKIKKEKPSYNVWQNSTYIIKQAWDRDSVVLYIIIAQILLTVGISTTGIFLPAVVVEQITSGAPVARLITAVLLFTAAIILMQMAKSYFDVTVFPKRLGLRCWVAQDMLNKVITTDYANLEAKQFTDAKQKAQDQMRHNNTSTERVYYCFADLGTNLLGFVVYILLLAAVNPFVLVISAATALFGAAARQWANKWQHNHDNEKAESDKRMNYITDLGEKYSMAKDIRLFGMTHWIKDIFDANLKLAFDFNRRVNIRHLIADGVNCIAIFSREGIAYAYLIWLVINGELAVDGFVLLFAAVGGFSGWISGILNEFAALAMHSLNYCRVREFLEYPEKFKREEGEPVTPEKGADYILELKNVSFRYSGTKNNTLENINLTIKSGEKLAIVGLNGAGKTTLVKLLCGFYDPTDGEVLLNGKDIRAFDRNRYYKLFTAVFQEFNILPISIAENISQQPTDEVDRTKVNHCLKLADLYEKVTALPDGISSLLLKDIHPEAAELSGGETQRLMLARALYKDAPILILDEPTAALDPIAESRLYERYNELSAHRTSLYISHRLASTRFCDRIILIDGKAIAESGTHDELMQAGGKYADLFEIQSKYYKEGVDF